MLNFFVHRSEIVHYLLIYFTFLYIYFSVTDFEFGWCLINRPVWMSLCHIWNGCGIQSSERHMEPYYSIVCSLVWDKRPSLEKRNLNFLLIMSELEVPQKKKKNKDKKNLLLKVRKKKEKSRVPQRKKVIHHHNPKFQVNLRSLHWHPQSLHKLLVIVVISLSSFCLIVFFSDSQDFSLLCSH